MIEELLLRIKEDFYNCLLLGITQGVSSTHALTGEVKELPPFNIQLIWNLDQGSMFIAVIALNPSNEVLALPAIAANLLKGAKEGKIGTGTIILGTKDSSSKDLVFTKQIHLYTDKINFDERLVKHQFKLLGLNLVIKEFGTSFKLERRTALIVGISKYEFASSLKNTLNDANSMNEKLISLGFDTSVVIDANQRELKQQVDDYALEAEKSDVTLFYYAGHGIQAHGVNYIIPADVNIATEKQLEYDCVRIDRVLNMMDHTRSRTNIMILDACRNNPFEKLRAIGGTGLAPMESPKGSFIAYATAPNSTASDGIDENGLYTSVLLNHMATPNITIEQIFKRVRKEVESKSRGKQIPWESTSLVGEFYFKK